MWAMFPFPTFTGAGFFPVESLSPLRRAKRLDLVEAFVVCSCSEGFVVALTNARPGLASFPGEAGFIVAT